MKDNHISIFHGWKLTNNSFKNAHTRKIRGGCTNMLHGDRDSAITVKSGYFWGARDIKKKVKRSL